MGEKLVIIPARGGSKGIPKKNIYNVDGKPLIYYTIKAAEEARKIGALKRVIVSTDSEEIAQISRNYGAEVPFIRPENLATDSSKSVDLMIHAIEFYQARQEYYKDVILLQPTSPLRSAEDIINAVKLYDKRKEFSLISCYKEESISEYNSYHLRGDIGIPVNVNHNKGKRRQELPELFVRNGAIFITDVNYLLESKLVISDKPIVFIMPKERSLNIDTQYDMELAEWLIKRKKNGNTKNNSDDC